MGQVRIVRHAYRVAYIWQSDLKIKRNVCMNTHVSRRHLASISNFCCLVDAAYFMDATILLQKYLVDYHVHCSRLSVPRLLQTLSSLRLEFASLH